MLRQYSKPSFSMRFHTMTRTMSGPSGEAGAIFSGGSGLTTSAITAYCVPGFFSPMSSAACSMPLNTVRSSLRGSSLMKPSSRMSTPVDSRRRFMVRMACFPKRQSFT